MNAARALEGWLVAALTAWAASLLKDMLGKLAVTVVLSTTSAAWAAVIPFTGGGGSFMAVSTGGQTIPDYPTTGISQSLTLDFAGI